MAHRGFGLEQLHEPITQDKMVWLGEMGFQET